MPSATMAARTAPSICCSPTRFTWIVASTNFSAQDVTDTDDLREEALSLGFEGAGV